MRKIHITVKDTNGKERNRTKSVATVIPMSDVGKYHTEYGINIINEAVIAANDELNRMTGVNVFINIPGTGSSEPRKLGIVKNENAKVHKSSIISRILRETPVATKLKVLFEMKWLDMNIVPDRHATQEEVDKACKWANEMVMHVLEETNIIDIQLKNEQLKSEHDYLISELSRRHKLLVKSAGQERETIIRDLLMGLPTE